MLGRREEALYLEGGASVSLGIPGSPEGLRDTLGLWAAAESRNAPSPAPLPQLSPSGFAPLDLGLMGNLGPGSLFPQHSIWIGHLQRQPGGALGTLR